MGELLAKFPKLDLWEQGEAKPTLKQVEDYAKTTQTPFGYRKRKWIAEPPNGWIKNVLGFRQFSMRGLQKAQSEFKLVCMALNLRRMGAMQGC